MLGSVSGHIGARAWNPLVLENGVLPESIKSLIFWNLPTRGGSSAQQEVSSCR